MKLEFFRTLKRNWYNCAAALVHNGIFKGFVGLIGATLSLPAR